MNSETESGEIRSGTDDDQLLQLRRQTEQQEIISTTMDMIPIDNMDFNDGCILLNLMYSIWVQIRQSRTVPDNFRDFWNSFIDDWYETDSNGRIIQLDIKGDVGGDNENAYSFDLPPTIECLRKLEDIALWNCKSIPEELENLKYLLRITCRGCPMTLFENNIPEEMELPEIKIMSLKAREFLSPSMLSLVTNRLMNLDSLILNCWNNKDPYPMIRALRRNCCFRYSLEHLSFVSSTFKDEEFGTIFFDILSDFSELRELNVPFCKIEGLTGIENAILLLSGTSIPQNHLGVLDLRGNPVANKIKEDDPKEKSALMTILNTFTGISRVGGIQPYPSEVEYLLKINHAGRKFISGRGDGNTIATNGATATTDNSSTNNDDINNKQSLPIIKPQLWPTILERSYQKSDEIGRVGEYNKCATGIYYLINREGSPILQHIILMHQNKQSELNDSTCDADESRKNPFDTTTNQGVQKMKRPRF